MFNRKGSVLIIAYLFLAVLLILGGAFFSRTLNEKKLFDMNRERIEAFYLAESAVDKGIAGLKNDYSGYSGTSATTAGRGQYEVTDVNDLSSTRKSLIAHGYIPNKAQKRVERRIEVVTKKETPADFYESAIYSAANIDPNGNSYVVNGKVVYATTIDDTSHITGTITHDPSVSPLAHFDFAVLRSIAVAQGNFYDSDRLDDVQHGRDSFPTSFWNVPPNPPVDPGTPNVVYLEGDMVLNGNVGTLGGFFLVVGNVLTDPNVTPDATINGNGEVDGCIYTLGDFRINGGAGGLNVNGGVWSGEESRLNGNATVTYNQAFMYAIKNLIETQGAGSVVQLLNWRELE
jgi:Tfp pilus assembly protein PilX